MTRTDENVRDLLPGKRVAFTPETAAQGVHDVIRVLEGRWKLVILFQLFGGQVRRFSDPDLPPPPAKVEHPCPANQAVPPDGHDVSRVRISQRNQG